MRVVAGETRYRYCLICILPKHEPGFIGHRCSTGNKQISDSLVVDLKVRERYFGYFVCVQIGYALEQLLHCQEDDAGLLCRPSVSRVSLCKIYAEVTTNVMVCVFPQPVAPYAKTVAL